VNNVERDRLSHYLVSLIKAERGKLPPWYEARPSWNGPASATLSQANLRSFLATKQRDTCNRFPADGV